MKRSILITGLFALALAACSPQTLTMNVEMRHPSKSGIDLSRKTMSIVYMDAGTAAIFGYVEPVVSLFLSAVILGEILGPVGWIGAVMILGSTLVYQLNARRSSAAR